MEAQERLSLSLFNLFGPIPWGMAQAMTDRFGERRRNENKAEASLVTLAKKRMWVQGEEAFIRGRGTQEDQKFWLGHTGNELTMAMRHPTQISWDNYMGLDGVEKLWKTEVEPSITCILKDWDLMSLPRGKKQGATDRPWGTQTEGMQDKSFPSGNLELSASWEENHFRTESWMLKPDTCVKERATVLDTE